MMLLMRDADLWTDVSARLNHCLGDKLGNAIGFCMELGAGETDLAAGRIEATHGDPPRQVYRRRLITARMVSSQAVVSEFVVTGVFLMCVPRYTVRHLIACCIATPKSHSP